MAIEIGTVDDVKVSAFGTPPREATRPLDPADSVHAEETVETVPDGALALRFKDNTELKLGSNAKVLLDKFVYDPDTHSGQLTLELGRGALRFVTGDIPKEGVTIETSFATMGVRGTDLIGFLTANALIIFVVHGSVWVLANVADAVEVVLNEGQSAMVTLSGRVVLNVPLPDYDPALGEDLIEVLANPQAGGPDDGLPEGPYNFSDNGSGQPYNPAVIFRLLQLILERFAPQDPGSSPPEFENFLIIIPSGEDANILFNALFDGAAPPAGDGAGPEIIVIVLPGGVLPAVGGDAAGAGADDGVADDDGGGAPVGIFLLTDIFTGGPNVVDLTNTPDILTRLGLDPTDVPGSIAVLAAAVLGGFNLSNALAGNDEVTLPDAGDPADPLRAFFGGVLFNGGPGDDTITGGDAADSIAGGSGSNDTLFGEGDGDLLYGDNGDGVADGDIDTLYGGAGADTLYGEGEGDLAFGGADDDTIYGDHADDDGFGGGDTLYGGSGDDTAYGEQGNDTLFGEEGFDVLRGGAGDDTVYGGEGSFDTLYGDNADDLLYGDDGDRDGGDDGDLLYGGSGADTAYGEGGDDTIFGGDNPNDFVQVGGIFQNALSPDVLYGDDSSDVIYGGAGFDHVFGGNQADTLYGDADTDTLYGGFDNDVLFGGDNTPSLGLELDPLEILYGQEGDDTLFGGPGIDRSYGGEGNDLVIWDVADGNDRAYGGTADGAGGKLEDTDTDIFQINGGALDDMVGVNAPASFVAPLVTITTDQGAFVAIDEFEEIEFYGGDGNDSLTIGDLNGTAVRSTTVAFYGGTGDDTLDGSAIGGDALAVDLHGFGGEGNDVLTGGSGSDSLDGGKGVDTLTSSSGTDVFVLREGDGSIYDGDSIDPNEVDLIQDLLYGTDSLGLADGLSVNDVFFEIHDVMDDGKDDTVVFRDFDDNNELTTDDEILAVLVDVVVDKSDVTFDVIP